MKLDFRFHEINKDTVEVAATLVKEVLFGNPPHTDIDEEIILNAKVAWKRVQAVKIMQ